MRLEISSLFDVKQNTQGSNTGFLPCFMDTEKRCGFKVHIAVFLQGEKLFCLNFISKLPVAVLGERGVLKGSSLHPVIKSKQRRVEGEKKKNIDFLFHYFQHMGI